MKYYYSDPLAAAWMARQYDIKFNSMDFSIVATGTGMVCALGDKYYIHPDSLKILEPQVGDIIQTESDAYPNSLPFNHFYDGAKFSSFIHFRKIIQRNGQVFFWPQVEE